MKKKTKEVRLVVDGSNTSKIQKTIRNTAQKTIPYAELYESGMFQVEKTKKGEMYSICFTMEHCNYSLIKDTEKQKIITSYQALFNSLSPDVHYQEIYINVPVDDIKLQQIIAPKTSVASTEFTEAYGSIQSKFIQEANHFISDTRLYFALSYTRKNKMDNPYNILMQSYAKISEFLDEMGVAHDILSPQAVLSLFYDIYNPFDIGGLNLPGDMYKKGLSVRDYIAPSSFFFKPNYTALGSAFNRTLYARDYPSELDDAFLSALLHNNYKIVVSKHVTHISKAQAIKTVQKRLQAMEADNQTRKKRNSEKGTTYIPLNLSTSISAAEEMLLTLQAEEMFDVGLYISISAETQEDLNDITKVITGVCSQFGVSLSIATFQQEKGMATIVPLANDKLNVCRYMYSSSVANLIPFSYQRLVSNTGFYYGRNALTRAPLIIDRKDDKNGNGFYVGKPGSGKSFYAKLEVIDVMHQTTKDKVIIIDPEREFTAMAAQMGGTVIEVSPSTTQFINPFDIAVGSEREENVIGNKIDLILGCFEVFKGEKLTGQERSILSRCTQIVYKPLYDNNFDPALTPTFVDFQAVLQQQPETEKKDLLLALEMYVIGTVNIFSHKTTVDLSNRLVVFDLKELNTTLKKVGMLIILDHIQNEMINNDQKGVNTWLYVDEFHLYFNETEDKNSPGEFFQSVFARCRKYGGFATGITQNITSVMKNEKALAMLQNSQFVVLLEQAAENLKYIGQLYDLSEKQKSRLVSCKRGEGIIITKNMPVPFNKVYPSDNIIYKTITTDFTDKVAAKTLAN